MKPRRSISVPRSAGKSTAEQIRKEIWLEDKLGIFLRGSSSFQSRMQTVRDTIATLGGGDCVLATRRDGTPLTAAQAFQETYGEAL